MKNIFLKLLIISIACISCEEEWLDVKRDKEQVVPQSLEDLQGLLDNSSVMNTYTTPCLGELSSDDLLLTDDVWNALTSQEQRNAYIWAKDIYDGTSSISWNSPYQQVYYSNLVLEGLEKISPSSAQAFNNVKGGALFYRSWAFFQLVQLFSKPYDPSTAATDAGVPLRLEPDINIPSSRAALAKVYDQIIIDLKVSLDLLPELPEVKTRPGKAAAYALLARTMLQMKDYENALHYAKASLAISNSLIDYNSIDLSRDFPFEQMNEEVIFHASVGAMATVMRNMDVSNDLLALYTPGDLRKEAYFTENDDYTHFKGSYDGSAALFSGMAIDELYLIAAESHARLGDIEQSMDLLNALLINRWERGSFVGRTASDKEAALSIILEERRKSLPFRTTRWMDLRRLNQQFQIEPRRIINGEEYVLPPGSNRYVLPIPDDVILITGMPQNER